MDRKPVSKIMYVRPSSEASLGQLPVSSRAQKRSSMNQIPTYNLAIASPLAGEKGPQI